MTKPKPGAKRGRPFSQNGQMPRVSVRIPQEQYDALRAMPGSLSANLQDAIHKGLIDLVFCGRLSPVHLENIRKQADSEQSGKKSRKSPN